MREQPWHTRFAQTEHSIRHQRLSALHRLTVQLAAAVGLPAPQPLPALADCLDDTSPDDSLGRLEAELKRHQAELVHTVQGDERLGNDRQMRLESAAQEAGREFAASHRSLPRLAEQGDCRILADHLRPYCRFLIRRSTLHELQMERLDCAHCHPALALEARHDWSCAVQAAWLAGYAQTWDPRVHIRTLPGPPGQPCAMSFTLPA